MDLSPYRSRLIYHDLRPAPDALQLNRLSGPVIRLIRRVIRSIRPGPGKVGPDNRVNPASTANSGFS